MSKYPILYKGDATDFFTLGLGPIQMLKATVTQERNGIFIFEGEILTDSPLFPSILENYIIKADADHLLKDQRFRIKRIVPNHDGKAEIYAEHVSYLSRELTIKPEISITGSAQTALSQWKASIVEPNPFVVDSDIPTSNKTNWRIDKVENPRMALGGVEGSILDVWGGEYRFDNYHISLLQKRGTTAKTVLAYGRNITDFEQERNIANTYTSIMPYAIYNDANENEVLVHIDGYVVDSEHINKYPNRVVQAVNFSSEFEHDEVPTKARLLALANQYIKANEIGVPSTSIKVSFVDLSKSPDYAEYAFLEQVNLCDDVRVHYPKLGVNTIAKVIRTVWNVLTESYDEIEIGQKRMSLVGQMQQQQQAIKEINTQTNYAMTSADGKNTIFYGLYGENGLGEPKAIKVGDTWYKPNGTGTDILVWTGTIWQVVLDAETFNEINEKIDQAEKDIAQNIIDIESALDKATQAELDAGFSKDLAGEAKALGITASSLAGEATTNANKAMTDAQEAIRQVVLNGGVAADASAEATEARRLASLAEGNSQEALTKANTSVTDASKALTDATKAFNKSFKSSAVAYASSTNGSTPPTTGWGTTVPSPSPDVYIWTRTTIVLNDNTPVVSYSVGKIGAKGDQGLKGDTGGQGIQGVPGANAPTITSVVQQFYLSTSTTTQTGGSWLSTVPVWSSGKYYWVRVVTTYSNGTTTTSTAVLDNALNDSLVTALEVKTANQNLSTTVTQHATLIESKANSTTVDAIAGRVTTAEGSISTIAGQVALKASTTDVNALTGRVTTAEGNITTQAGQIALRATTATVNTLTGRVSTAEGKITTQAGLIELKADTTTVNTLTGRVSAAEASLSVQSGKIDLAATKTELTNAIDDIEIGGRNYLTNTEIGNVHPIRIFGSNMEVNGFSLHTGAEYYTLEVNTSTVEAYYRTMVLGTVPPAFSGIWTFSGEILIPEGTSGIPQTRTQISINSPTGWVNSYGNGERPIDATEGVWTKFTHTFEMPEGTQSLHMGIKFATQTQEIGDKIHFKNFKLEKGNKATDWSPAPEDVDSAISTVQANLTVEAGKIASKASQTDFNALIGRVGTAESTITQHTTAIALRATKTDLDATNGRVTTAEGTITVQAGQIALKASQTSVDSLTGRVGTAETNISANTTAINLRATKTSVDTLTGRVSTAEGNITTQAGLIALKANQSVVDTLTGRVSTTEAQITATDGKVTTLTTKTDGNTTSIGQLQTSYSGLSSTVTQVKNNLEGMEIGGRNLIVTTESLDGYSYKTSDKYLNFNIARTTKGATGYADTFSATTIDVAEGVKYTASFFARTSVASVIMCYWYYPNTTIHAISSTGQVTYGLDGGVLVTTSTDWKRYWVTWTQSTTTAVKHLIIGRNHLTPEGTIVEIAGVKLEKGNKATDWSPAPEDYTTVVAFSALEQNLNGFKTTVANTYADKTQVTQLSTQWTTTTNLVNGHTSQIASLGTDINLRATKTEVDDKILADKTIKDTRNDNQLPTWYYTNYPKQKAYEFKICATIGLPTSAGTYASVVTEVPWSDASGGTIEQTATATDGVYQRRGTATWSAWAKVADSSNIVSQINISPESILIASNKIQIKGDTYIDNGVIKTAHIADLAVDGAKIANATIGSAKIISLDASKITATSLSAITTNTGALNVSGWLTTTTENYGFRGTYNYGDELYGAYNPRWFDGDYRLSHRYLTFQANVYDVNSNNTRGEFKYYGETFYGADYLKLRQYTSSTNKTIRARVDVTADSIIIGPNFNGAQSIILNSNATSFFAKDASFADGITVNSQNQDGVRTGRINAPMNYNTLILNNNRNLGTLELGYDTSRYLRAKDVYDRTYSLASNMIVTNEGTLGRATSARKYKTNIVELKEIYSKAKDVLQIQPVTWLDKRALIETGTEQRGYGFIADDFHELGLTEVVQYGSDGQVEGLAYDRISMYHNVILQDHEQQLKRLNSITSNVIKLVANDSIYGLRLNNLESEVCRLKKRIEELEKIA